MYEFSYYDQANSISLLKPEVVGDQYRVVFLRDDITLMSFVEEMLMEHFDFEEMSARRYSVMWWCMDKIEIGEYDFDTARFKKLSVIAEARSRDFPLQINIEKV